MYQESHRQVEKYHRESETVMNELKMLRETDFNLEDDETREVLKKMKKNIKKRWLSSN
jgi:polyphosphate kinase